MTSHVHLPVGTGRPADLPDFKRPPVVEVVLGVQFSELTAYRTWHAGLLWDSTFRADFPTCVERPPLDPVFETFGSQMPARTPLTVRQMSAPPVPRLWFINKEESQLIQFQSDRFLHNWRRQREDVPYPRYETIRERFFDEISAVISFLDSNDIGLLAPNQCEVTYVNDIVLADTDSSHFDPARIFSFWSPIYANKKMEIDYANEFEGGRFAITSVLLDKKNREPLGRLHVVAEPGIENDNSPIFRLSLTARGGPISPSLQGVADFFDLGREAIVRTFAAITTDEMHSIWGRLK